MVLGYILLNMKIIKEKIKKIAMKIRIDKIQLKVLSKIDEIINTFNSPSLILKYIFQNSG